MDENKAKARVKFPGGVKLITIISVLLIVSPGVARSSKGF